MKKIGTTGHFYKKLKKYFFETFFTWKSKYVGILDLKNNFRFEFSDLKLVGIDTHIAGVPKFCRRSSP